METRLKMNCICLGKRPSLALCWCNGALLSGKVAGWLHKYSSSNANPSPYRSHAPEEARSALCWRTRESKRQTAFLNENLCVALVTVRTRKTYLNSSSQGHLLSSWTTPVHVLEPTQVYPVLMVATPHLQVWVSPSGRKVHPEDSEWIFV